MTYPERFRQLEERVLKIQNRCKRIEELLDLEEPQTNELSEPSPELREQIDKFRAIHGHPPLPAGPPRRTPAEVAEKACDMGMFPRAILAHIADLISRDRKGTA